MAKKNKNDTNETQFYSNLIFAELQRKELPVEIQLSSLAQTIIDICRANNESRRSFQDLIFAMYDKFVENY